MPLGSREVPLTGPRIEDSLFCFLVIIFIGRAGLTAGPKVVHAQLKLPANLSESSFYFGTLLVG